MSAQTTTVNATPIYEIGDKVVVLHPVPGADYFGEHERLNTANTTMDNGKILTVTEKDQSSDRRTSIAPLEVEYIYRLGYIYRGEKYRTIYSELNGANPAEYFKGVAHLNLRLIYTDPTVKTRPNSLYGDGDVVRLMKEASNNKHGVIVKAPVGSLMIVKGNAKTLSGGQHERISQKNAYYSLTLAGQEKVYDIFWKSSHRLYAREVQSID